jgi:hypothetical protein
MKPAEQDLQKRPPMSSIIYIDLFCAPQSRDQRWYELIEQYMRAYADRMSAFEAAPPQLHASTPLLPALPSPRGRKGKGGVKPTHNWPAGDQEAARFSLAYQREHGQLPDKTTLVNHMEDWWKKQKTTPRRKVIARKLPTHLYRNE